MLRGKHSWRCPDVRDRKKTPGDVSHIVQAALKFTILLPLLPQAVEKYKGDHYTCPRMFKLPKEKLQITGGLEG